MRRCLIITMKAAEATYKTDQVELVMERGIFANASARRGCERAAAGVYPSGHKNEGVDRAIHPFICGHRTVDRGESAQTFPQRVPRAARRAGGGARLTAPVREPYSIR